MKQQVKQVPYGVSDFATVMSQNLYYVDKTMFLPEVEKQPRNLFFVRPRRFGKSLFLSMLYSYYDCNQKESFEKLFGNLWIGQHPTSLQGIYQVLFLDFSQITGKIEVLEERFNAYLCIKLDSFAEQYAAYYGDKKVQEIKAKTQYADKMQIIFDAARANQFQLYLIIDEYDNFTNVVLNEHGEKVYHAITHADGFYRDVFKKFKGNFERIFMMGVSPVTLDDVTSGFNIGANMTTDYRFNGIIGFSEGEVREMLAYYKSETGFEDSVDDLINLMKPWYDNYRFSTKSLDEPMYNSDMVLYFISNYLPLRSAPDKMIDNNIRTDYNKLRHLIRLDKRFGTNASIIQEIVNNGETTAVIKDAFPAEDIAKPDNFKSLLYYFGLLSIKGTKRGDTLLGVPNLTVREQLYTYLIEAYREADVFSIELYKLHDLVKDMAYDGDWKPVFEYFSSELERQSAIREFIEGEAHVKGFLLAYLGLTRTYIIYPEYEANKGYADFYMMPDLIHQPEIGFSYIVKVKYARRDASETEIEALRAEAAIQLRRYAADPKVHATKGDTELRLVTLVFKGWKLAVCEMDLA